MASYSVRVEGATNLKRTLRGIIDEMSKDLTNELRKTTPVDTGRARRGWSRKLTGSMGARISNKVPYISFLEKGHSQQAPKGMITPSINKIESNFRSGKYNRKRGRK